MRHFQIMIEIRDHVHKLRSFARAGRSQDYQDSYEPAIIASQMEMTSKTAENTLLCELEAVEKIDIFEMDGLHCSYDQGENQNQVEMVILLTLYIRRMAWFESLGFFYPREIHRK